MDYFSGIKGQDKSIYSIRKAIQEARVSHAYLFLGPEGVGKMATARAFASQLLEMGDIQAGMYLSQNIHPDLLVIEKEENRTLIGIEQITRNMEPWLALKPFRSDFRVVIIRDAQLLSEPAGNALLKVLEDPPPYAVIILITDQANLMETILSRCHAIRFFSLSDATVEECLIEKDVDHETAAWAARLAQGSVGKAWAFISEEDFAKLWDRARQMVGELGGESLLQVFLAAETMEKHSEILGAMMETILRDIYIYSLVGKQDLLIFADNLGLAQRFHRAKPDNIMGKLEQIAQLKRHYRQNINPMLLNIHVAYAVHEALQ